MQNDVPTNVFLYGYKIDDPDVVPAGMVRFYQGPANGSYYEFPQAFLIQLIQCDCTDGEMHDRFEVLPDAPLSFHASGVGPVTVTADDFYALVCGIARVVLPAGCAGCGAQCCQCQRCICKIAINLFDLVQRYADVGTQTVPSDSSEVKLDSKRS